MVEGASKALVRPERSCPEIHGQEGLDTLNPELMKMFPSHEELYEYGNKNDILSQEKAINLMASTFLSKEKVTLVCTGSLTNVALLFSIYPEVKQHISKIVSMGGSVGGGNTSPCAEWNIEIDPEAAKIVYGSGVPFVQVPLNVTHTVLFTDSIAKRLEDMNSQFSMLIGDLLMFFSKTYKDVFGFDFPPLHDPVAIAYVINPSLFETKFLNVEIETNSSYCDGATVADIFGTTGRKPNVTVCLKVDVDKFWDLQLDAIKHADKNSPLNK